MAKTLCKLPRRELRSNIGEVQNSATSEYFVCQACSRITSMANQVCKPKALVVNAVKPAPQPDSANDASLDQAVGVGVQYFDDFSELVASNKRAFSDGSPENDLESMPSNVTKFKPIRKNKSHKKRIKKLAKIQKKQDKIQRKLEKQFLKLASS